MALPPGLLLNPATGELTGVPTVAGDYVIALKVRDALGSVRELTDALTINAYTPMVWAGVMGPLMATRPATAVTINVSNGLGPYTFQVFSGALPDGMTIDTSTGVISGTPTTAGAYACLLRVTDTLSQTADLVVAGTVVDNLTIEYDGTGQGTVGVRMEDECVQFGGTPDYTYAIVAGTLPAGLELDNLIGLYVGYPTAPSSATVTVRATDANGFTADATINFDIAAFPTLSGGLPRGTAGKAYTGSLTATGGHTPYSWAMVVSGVSGNPGLSINASTGAITGSPAAASSGYTLKVFLTDALGNQVEDDVTIVVAGALTISGSYATNAARGAAYSTFNPTVTGGWAPFSFDISAGALPTGLSLNASTGVISGSTTAQGTFTATLRVTDADGSTATMAFNVNVAGDLSITGSAPNFGTTIVAYTGDTLAGSGGATPYSWSVSAGSLPPGITLNTSTGDLSGTPTGIGAFSATIKLTDANASFATVSVPITVAAFPNMTGTMPDGSVGIAFSAQYSSTGGHAPLVYSISAGTLPTGLSLNTSTGAVTGTPSAAGSFTFTIKLTDAHSNFTTRGATVDIFALPSISGTVSSAAEVDIAYSDTSLSASGGKSPLSWSVQGTLPPGLSMSGSTGAITGTPTAAGTYAFTAKVTDALGQSSTSSQTITAVAHLAATGAAAQATRTIAYASGTPAITVTGGSGSKTYAISSGALPGGLSLNTSTGAVSGTPTAAGTFSYTIRATDALGATASASISHTVANPVDLTLPSPAPNGTVGVAYSWVGPPRTGGFGPFYYSLAAGSSTGFPNGTLPDNNTGVISGTPTLAGTYTPTLRVTDNGIGGGSTDSQGFTITIVVKPTLTLSYPRGTVGQAYSGTASTSGGQSPFSYARVAGSFPAGLALNASTGTLSGTPTASGTLDSTIRMTDALGNTDDASAHIAIAGALVVNDTFSDGKQGIAYSSSVSASGGWTPRTFSKVAGTLPTGLSLSSAGALTGTPSAAGTFNFTVRVTDADGNTADRAVTVVIATAAVMNVTASPNPARDEEVGNPGTTLTARVSVVASVSNPTGAVTHSWTFVSASGDTGSFTVGGTSTATLVAQVTKATNSFYNRTEVWRDTVHDSGGHTDTVDVPITLSVSNSL